MIDLILMLTPSFLCDRWASHSGDGFYKVVTCLIKDYFATYDFLFAPHERRRNGTRDSFIDFKFFDYCTKSSS